MFLYISLFLYFLSRILLIAGDAHFLCASFPSFIYTNSLARTHTRTHIQILDYSYAQTHLFIGFHLVVAIVVYAAFIAFIFALRLAIVL